MWKLKKKLLMVLFSLNIVVFFVSGAFGLEFQNYKKDHVVAEVHGKKFTVGDIIKFSKNQPTYYSFLYLPQGPNNILREMILRELLRLEGHDLNIPKDPEESEEYYIRKVLDKLFPEEPDLTEEQLKDFYKDHKELFSTPPLVRLSQIRVYLKTDSRESDQEALEKIRKAQKMLKEGEPFHEVAMRFSDDKFIKEREGDLGFIKVDDIKPENLKKLIKGMKKGQVSDIQRIDGYYAIFKVVDVREPITEPFDADYVRTKALKYLAKQDLEEIREKLSRKWGVTYVDPAFGPDK